MKDGLMLGLVALMDNQYRIKSNRESGDGRYDADMTEAGIQNILKLGIAFSEKKVSVKTK
jgi:hypothetical protein